MHFSRMRTGRSLTVCWSLLPGGGLLRGGVSAPMGEGCLLRGCLLPGGQGMLGGCISQHALRQTLPPPVDRHTLVKILPWPNFVAAGKNFVISWKKHLMVASNTWMVVCLSNDTFSTTRPTALLNSVLFPMI